MSGRMGVMGAVGLALESTWGQPAPPTTHLEVSYADIRPVIGYEIPNLVRGTRGRRGVRQGAMVCAGALSFEVCAGGIGEVLKAALGTVTTTLVASGGGAAVYQHTFTRCDTTFLPSLTVEQNLGGLTSRLITGVRVNQLSLALRPGRSLAADVDCRGREEALVSPSSASYPADEALHFNGFEAEVGGVECTEVEDFVLRFHNGLVDDVWTAGSAGKVGKLPAGTLAVSGRMSMAVESTAAHQAFVNGTATNLKLRMSGATLVGTWGYGLEIELPRVRYFSADAPLTPGRLVYDIAFEGVLDTSQVPPVEARCKVWNARAAY